MRIREADGRDGRDDGLIEALTGVWEWSVRATHHFLAEADVERIGGYVPQALREVGTLVVAEREDGTPVAFMGIDGDAIEMLFVDADERGRGLGGRLVRLGVERYGVRRLDVNEQNPRARGFYEHMGFRVSGRSATDGQGEPYPILHMALPDGDVTSAPEGGQRETTLMR